MDQVTVLVVDDDDALRELLVEQLSSLGYRVAAAASAEMAVDMLPVCRPDLVLTDVHMGAMSGVDLCRHIKTDPEFQLMPVVILTAVADVKARIAGLDAGADDFFSKPVDLLELQTRLGALVRVKTLVDQLERAEGIITTLGLTIEARDPYTANHCERLARYAVAVGQTLGVDAATQRALRLGGFLHDLGKIAVPDAILLKPGPLSPDERARMTRHPVAGVDLLRGLKTLEQVRPIVRHHHERWDGSGYPDGLRGEAIPLAARIMAVVDVYDALNTQRPYKAAHSHAESIAILRRETDQGFWDPRVVTAFIETLSGVGRGAA